VRLLLDTCTFLWAIEGGSRISEAARSALTDPAHEVLLSSVSAWEIGVKHGLGRLPLPEPPERYVPAQRKARGIEPLPLDEEATLHLQRLPPNALGHTLDGARTRREGACLARLRGPRRSPAALTLAAPVSGGYATAAAVVCAEPAASPKASSPSTFPRTRHSSRRIASWCCSSGTRNTWLKLSDIPLGIPPCTTPRKHWVSKHTRRAHRTTQTRPRYSSAAMRTRSKCLHPRHSSYPSRMPSRGRGHRSWTNSFRLPRRPPLGRPHSKRRCAFRLVCKKRRPSVRRTRPEGPRTTRSATNRPQRASRERWNAGDPSRYLVPEGARACVSPVEFLDQGSRGSLGRCCCGRRILPRRRGDRT